GEAHKGKRASMVRQLARQIMDGPGDGPKLFEWGEQEREYAYVDDIVRANLAATHAQQSCVVNIGTGSSISFNALVARLNDALGVKFPIKPQYIKNPHGTNYQAHTLCDMRLAKEKIGFEASFDISRGIIAYHNSGTLLD
ncbi:MAG: NAD-dependent epimerase/dehydratase family protein, partial [Nanoarchaeota archaeon]